MANNKYTSPRDYIARGYKSKSRVKTKSHFEMGIGYTIPDGISKAEFKAEYAKWEKKLQNSGFDDIEYRSPSQSGHFTPFFKVNGSTATFMRLYDESTEEYYRLTRHFDSYMSEIVNGRSRWARKFRYNAKVYRTLWYLHIEGVPYRAVAKAFSGQPSKWLKGLKPVSKSLIQSRSVFWAHNHTARIMDLFWAWASTFEIGYADPRHTQQTELRVDAYATELSLQAPVSATSFQATTIPNQDNKMAAHSTTPHTLSNVKKTAV